MSIRNEFWTRDESGRLVRVSIKRLAQHVKSVIDADAEKNNTVKKSNKDATTPMMFLLFIILTWFGIMYYVWKQFHHIK